MIYIYSNKFFISNITITGSSSMSYVVIYYCSNNTVGSALILLRINNNTAVAVTLIVFLYFQMETYMIDQHLNFVNLKIEIISS